MKTNYSKFGFVLLIYLFVAFNAKSQVDAKYLQGAVPEVNGKVVFSDTIAVPGMSKDAIYTKVLQWAEANFNNKENRVLLADKEKGNIACKGQTTLVFQAKALSLDQAEMNFHLVFFISNNLCTYSIRSISYDYLVANLNKPDRYTAEEWITDKEAVNKDKLYRNNGKFRIKTIDLVDDIYNSLMVTFSSGEIDLYTERERKNAYQRKTLAPLTPTVPLTAVAPAPVENPIQVTETAVLMSSTTPTAAAPAGYKRLDPEKIPGNIIKMLTEDWMLITAGNDTKFNMMTAGWGGLGVLFSKPVSYCFINPARYTLPLMETNETYTLSFYTETYRDALRYCGSNSGKDADKVKGSGLTPITMPSGCKAFSEAWMIIECKKVLEQALSADAVKDETVKKEWNQSNMPKMFAGEILNVWVK